MNRFASFLSLAALGCLLASPGVRAQDSDAAFQGFLDALQTSRELVLSRTSEDGTDRAEGLRQSRFYVHQRRADQRRIHVSDLRQAGDGAVCEHAGFRQPVRRRGLHDVGRVDRGA